jgi:hypothetical protein
VIEESNSFAADIIAKNPNSLPNWHPLTVDEFCTFLALHLLMGVMKKPTLKEYWFTNPLLDTPAFRHAISRNRYESILRSLHFADNTNPNPSNKLWKLGNFLPNLLDTFEQRVTWGSSLPWRKVFYISTGD